MHLREGLIQWLARLEDSDVCGFLPISILTNLEYIWSLLQPPAGSWNFTVVQPVGVVGISAHRLPFAGRGACDLANLRNAPGGRRPQTPPALAIVHASATTCMHYGHSTHMYYGHSTCWYCSQSKCMYYGQSPCIYYGHSTCMYYGRDICMYSGHSTCMYYGHSTCMYYGLRTYMYYGHHRTCMYDGHINGHRTYSTANRPCCMAHSLSE